MAEIFVTRAGSLRWIHDESETYPDLGAVRIRRASHVEPIADGRWTADLRPVGGPVLGPFPTRSAGLEAERQWLLSSLGHLELRRRKRRRH